MLLSNRALPICCLSFVLFFVNFVNTNYIAQCVNTDITPSFSLPNQGKAIIQFEIGNTTNPVTNPNTIKKILLFWSLFDFENQLFRLDVPNPSIFFGVDPDDYSPILVSFILRLSENKLVIDNQINQTCSIQQPNFPLNITQNLFSFVYKGTDNVNSHPAYKWFASIPFIGDFIYFGSCDNQKTPFQLQFMPKLDQFFHNFGNQTDWLFGQLDLVHSHWEKEFARFNQTWDQTTALTYSTQLKNYKTPPNEQESTGPLFAHWDPANFNANLPTSLHKNYFILDLIANWYSDITQFFSIPKTKIVETNLGANRSPQKEGKLKDSRKNTNLMEHDPIRSNATRNYIEYRISFIDWVNGVLDPLVFVPAPYCTAHTIEYYNLTEII